jgi:catechol 2,3-dioxygenase-like lactoylglutathione lyase family enzyme
MEHAGGDFSCLGVTPTTRYNEMVNLGNSHWEKLEMAEWLGLRHVALNVRDVDISMHFYQEVLGFALEWRPDPDNVYLTSGMDNLALHKAAGITLDNPDQHLDHFGFVVGRPEEVDAWADRIRQKGILLERAPRTHRDGARSFYFLDPDSNRIQIIYHPLISAKCQ